MIENLDVVSLFDGMSCGQIALNRLGVKPNRYFASEIDKHAIAITKKNFPDTIHLGSVTDIISEGGIFGTWLESYELSENAMLIGGSPCQDFSFAGSRRGMVTSEKMEVTTLEQYLELKESGFQFKGQSFLFWEYVRILKSYKFKYFLLENVKMAKKWSDLISSIMGVEPIEINSSLVSAQNRKRLYWTNIPNVTIPEDRGILLEHIILENSLSIVDRSKSLALTANYQKLTSVDYFEKSRGQKVLEIDSVTPYNKELVLHVPEATKAGCTEVQVGQGVDITHIASKTRRGRLMDTKSNCLTLNMDYCTLEELKRYIVPFNKTLQIIEKEVARGKVGFFGTDSQANRVYYIHGKAVTLCGQAGGGAAKMGQYLFGCITPDRVEKRQNGQRFNEGRKFYTLTAQDNHGILIEGYIRKLTPVECERLQTVDDNYTEGVSQVQRYRMLGNGWTVDVIAHLFSFIPWH